MLGHWPDPMSFRFGLHFQFRAVGTDLEHQHLTEALGTGTRQAVRTASGVVKATTEATVQPVVREFLFDATLTLYVSRELGQAFREPVYPVVLGRSQDLAEVISVEEITLHRSERIRLEHTLLPWRLRPCVPGGATVLLSRYISEPPRREAVFGRYVALHDAVFLGGELDGRPSVLRVAGIEFDALWSDPGHIDEEGFERGVWMHGLQEAT